MMAKDSKELIPLLSSLRLFSGLDEAQLELVAAVTEMVELAEGQSLPLPADQDYPFYLILDGKVRHIRPLKGKVELQTLKKEDIFGAEILLTNKRKEYRIEALQKTHLLRIGRDQLALLLRGIPTLRSTIREQLALYRLLRRKTFSWLGDEESVYLIQRQHPAFMIVSLMLPLLLAWGALLVFFLSLASEASSLSLVFEWIAIGLLIAAVLWGLWKFLDWLNDYYIVTDRRVVALRRVILIYESREEATMTAIRSEEVETSLLGRTLGYGDLVTQAYMGRVVFQGIRDPRSVREIIEGLRKRSSVQLKEADRQTMESIIRRKIDPKPEPPPQPAEPVKSQPVAKPSAGKQKPVPFRKRMRQYFQTYKEEGGVITYRKHILILLRMTWFPGLVITILVTVTLYILFQRLFGGWTEPPILMLLAVSLTMMIPFFVWWLYQYVDWKNDIYQITDEKIIDSEKKPLGTEITRSAPLENILNLDYQRIGFWGVLFNMGNVIINAGTDKLTWMHLSDPARAQREIFNRMYEQRRRKQLEDSKKEWDQVSDWLAAYHRQAEDMRKNPNHPQQ